MYLRGMHWKRNVQSASPCDLSPLTLSVPSGTHCPVFQLTLILLCIKFVFTHKFCIGSSSLFDSMGWHILSSWNVESSKWCPKCFICSPHVWHSIAVFISWYLHGYSRFLSLQVELTSSFRLCNSGARGKFLLSFVNHLCPKNGFSTSELH